MSNIKFKIESQAIVFSDIYKDPMTALIATILWIDYTYNFRYINEMLSSEIYPHLHDAGFGIDQHQILELSELAEFNSLYEHRDIFIDILFRSNKDEMLANKICLVYDEFTNKKGVAYRALLSTKDDEAYFNYQSNLKRKRGI